MTKIKKEVLKNELRFLQETDDFKKMNSNGLSNGNMGIALVFHLLAKQTGDKFYLEKASQILELIGDSGVSGADLSFNNGITGIGWGVEWLAQNRLMEETNTDEILESIDCTLYRVVCFEKDANPTLSNGTLGKIAYFLKRASARNPNTSRYKIIGHLECIILLLDDLDDKIKTNLGDCRSEWSILGDIIRFISSLKVKVNSPTTGKIMYDSINKAEKILADHCSFTSSETKNEDEDYFELLYLMICFLIAADHKNNKFWYSQTVTYLESVMAVTNPNYELTTNQLFRKLAIYCIINIYCPQGKYQKKIRGIIECLTPRSMPPSLINGRGALVVAELTLLNPELINSWQEIMLID